MKTKPILFSTPMVQAIINGNKTQTRRVVKLDKLIDIQKFVFSSFIAQRHIYIRGKHILGEYGESLLKMPICKGDILWVRETWADASLGKPISQKTVAYKADYTKKEINLPKNKGIWKPSIFMPKKACRLFLKVTDVWVERLQDISIEDAKKEGVLYDEDFKKYNCYLCDTNGHKGDDLLLCEDGFFDSPIVSFESLWQSINGKDSWVANPWVWVYSFKRCQMPDNFLN